jgi:hypothetical protein
MFLKAKEELFKTQIFISPLQKYNLNEKSSKRNQKIPSTYYNSIIIQNLKFQYKSQNISCFRNPHIIKIDLLLLLLLLLLPRGQNPH